MSKADIGLIGLAVMGQNLALNMDEKGFAVAVHNRSAGKIKDFIDGPAASTRITGHAALDGLWMRCLLPGKLS